MSMKNLTRMDTGRTLADHTIGFNEFLKTVGKAAGISPEIMEGIAKLAEEAKDTGITGTITVEFDDGTTATADLGDTEEEEKPTDGS